MEVHLMRTKFVKIVKKLGSKSEKKREEAMRELADLEIEEIHLEHLEYMIVSTTKVYQDNDNHLEDASGALMEFIARYDITEQIPILAEHFPNMSIWARSIVLTLLTRAQTTESLQTLLDLLETYIDELPFTDFQIDLMGNEQECTDILFPKIMDYIEYPSISYTINRYVWLCLNKGTIKKDKIKDYAAIFLHEYHFIKKTIEAYQSKLTTNTKWSQAYQELRSLAGLFLDIFGFLPIENINEELEEALGFSDNRLRYFALSSMLRLQLPIDNQLIKELASDNETRNFLYNTLKEYNKDHLYPKEYFHQTAFAESELVSWLVYPTELGHVPSEIECMEVFTRYHEELGAVDYYIFRFRSDHEDWEEVGWMAGVAGYYIQNQAPTQLAHGYTFSMFENWEMKTAEEHLETILDVLEQLWKNQME